MTLIRTEYEYGRAAQLARIDKALDEYRYRAISAASSKTAARRVAKEAVLLLQLEDRYEDARP